MTDLARAFSGKHAVVAGGAGFLGSHLCDRLLSLGAKVTAVDNEITGDPRNLAGALKTGGISYVKADVSEALPAAGEKVHFVFNLASPASPLHYTRFAIETLRAGSIGTENLLRLATEQEAVFLQASTSEVYGDPEVHPQPESYWGRVNPVGPRSMYDEAKRYGEAVCVAYERSRGTRLRIARIFNTYGPRMQLDDGRVVPNFIGQALRGEPFTVYGEGKQTRSFCYVDDLVEGLLRLAASDAKGPVNLGSHFEFTILELAKTVHRLTGSRSTITYKPLPGDDPKQRRPDTAKAKQLLGWEAHTPLEEGLRRTIDSFRK
ncbi:MAG: UDP-glucuronic acid decarboxylase family protein [Bdellovibrionota bacterium]